MDMTTEKIPVYRKALYVAGGAVATLGLLGVLAAGATSAQALQVQTVQGAEPQAAAIGSASSIAASTVAACCPSDIGAVSGQTCTTCGNYVDANGDGVCDNYGTGTHHGKAHYGGGHHGGRWS